MQFYIEHNKSARQNGTDHAKCSCEMLSTTELQQMQFYQTHMFTARSQLFLSHPRPISSSLTIRGFQGNVHTAEFRRAVESDLVGEDGKLQRGKLACRHRLPHVDPVQLP